MLLGMAVVYRRVQFRGLRKIAPARGKIFHRSVWFSGCGFGGRPLCGLHLRRCCEGRFVSIHVPRHPRWR
jgi:hypothetical protein